MTRFTPALNSPCARALRFLLLVVTLLGVPLPALAQSESATLSGMIMDKTGAVIVGVQVQVTNSETNVSVGTVTNSSGVYVLPSLKPGRYREVVTKPGLQQVNLTDLILNVQDVVNRNFNLAVGAASESVTVTADQKNINTTDGSVSTVVDQTYLKNMPLNGRSFQDLILLAPGTVTQTPQPSPSASVLGATNSLGQA